MDGLEIHYTEPEPTQLELELPTEEPEEEILDLLKSEDQPLEMSDYDLDTAVPMDDSEPDDEGFLPTEEDLIHLAQCLQSEHNATMQEIFNALQHWEDLEDQGYDDDDTQALTKAWSDEAREAARAARTRRFAAEPGPFANTHINDDRPERTTVNEPTEAAALIRAPRTDGVKLDAATRPTSFVTAHRLITEKYGPHRGDGIYNSIIDRSESGASSKGLHYIVSSKIQKEKLAMMQHLGKTGHPDQHHYQGLHKLHKDKARTEGTVSTAAMPYTNPFGGRHIVATPHGTPA